MTSIRTSVWPALLAIFILVAGCSGTTQSSVAPVASAAASVPARATSSASTTSQTPAPSRIAVLDGEAWLLYAWYQPGKEIKDVFLARSDGTDAHPIVGDVPGEHTAPSWSADGAHIVFVVRDPPTSGGSLWTANADGSGATLLFAHGDRCAEAFHPAWSPDGKLLAFVCYVDDLTATVQVLDPVSMSIKELTRVAWPEFIDNQPRWSSDGRTIAFDTMKWDQTNQFPIGSLIATVPAGGGNVHRLTDFASFASAPDWSPDDSVLAFNTYDLGNVHGTDQPSNVYTVAPDGTNVRQITTASTDGTMRIGLPRWSADGSRIWVSVTREGETGPSIAWIDPLTGALHELPLEGKGPRPRPLP